MVQRDNRSEIHKFIHNISRDGVDMDLRIQRLYIKKLRITWSINIHAYRGILLSKIIINYLIYLAAVMVALSSRTTGRPNIDTKILECQLLFLQKRMLASHLKEL